MIIEEEKKKKEEEEKLKSQSKSASIPLPPSSTNSKLVQNYETLKEIVGMLKEESMALDTAVNRYAFII